MRENDTGWTSDYPPPNRRPLGDVIMGCLIAIAIGGLLGVAMFAR